MSKRSSFILSKINDFFPFLLTDGNTIRGCASELDNATAAACHNELECLICSFAEGCNRRLFPLSRAQCLQCSGNSTSDCATNVYARPTVCPLYKLGDRCYVRNDGELLLFFFCSFESLVLSILICAIYSPIGKNKTESFQRGCLSSAQAKKLCVNDGNCFICEGVGCNFLAYNSTQIPIARDGAAFISSSMALLGAALLALRWV